MKLTTLGMTTATLSLLGTLSIGAVAHAQEISNEAKDTNTQIKLIDSPDPDPSVLKLMHVPEQYNFETKLNADGAYVINGGSISDDKTLIVFNDKSTQDWSVKASIADTELATASGKTATVTAFKINGQDLMGENANQIIFKSEENKTSDNNTGTLSKVVTGDDLSVEFSNANRDLKAGDILTGKVHYQLFNTPDAK